MPADQPAVASVIAASIQLAGETSYSFEGAPVRSQPDLRELIYRVYHCRQSHWFKQDRSPFAVDRAFEHRLSTANCGKGSWDGGWTIVRVESAADIVVAKNGLRIWVCPSELRVARCQVGEVGAIALGKEMRRSSFGYYLLLGNRNLESEDDIVRIYWTVTAKGAPLLVRYVTERMNAADIPFRFKTVNLPGGFDRSDAAVLYLRDIDLTVWAEEVAALYALIRGHLRPETSLFARRLGPGLALAEDYGGPTSFGRGMAGMCAEGLVAAFTKGKQSPGERADEILACLETRAVDPSRPYLRPESHDHYAALDRLFDR